MTSFYANVLICTIGGTKRAAAADHKKIREKWLRRPDVTDIRFDEPRDFNNDVEGLGEWTTSFDVYFDAPGEAAARSLIESLLKAEKERDVSGEIFSLRGIER